MGTVARSFGLLALSLVAASGCKGGDRDVALSKASEPEDEGIPNVPVPPENGPKLVALRADVPVLERPKKDAPAVGALLFGAPVARADKPYRKNADCEGGWYPVRPRGFVCASADVSLSGGALVAAPDTSRALPYRFGTTRSATPLYARLPTTAEQIENEPSLEKHLAKSAKELEKPSSLRAGANDVPLDERSVASGVAVLARGGEGIGEDGRRTRASFFELGTDAPPPLLPDRLSGPPVAGVLRKGSGVAFVGTTVVEGPRGPRRFAITPDGAFVPADRLEPALGSTWHGVDLTGDKALPVAFVLRHEVCPYALSKGKAERLEDDEVDRRTPVFLTGRFRTVDGVRFEEAQDGNWFRDRDLIKVIKRSKFPDFVTEGTRWIDVSLALQTATLYEGKKAIYTTLVSTGQDVLGDPATSAATAQGTFTVQRKVLLGGIDDREVGQAFEPKHVPYQLELAPGLALTASYWSDHAGEARSFHNVAMTPIDAHRVFAWAGPEVPPGFSWITPTEDETVTVHIRK